MALDLAYDTLGKGPPLMILHGLFGSRGNWRRIARELAATHAVYMVDLRNHGDSPWADSMSYDEMADDVLRLIESLGLKDLSLLGHSMGGKTAMALALRHPQSVARLLVVDIAPVSYVDTLSPFAQAMQGANVIAAVSRADVQRRLAQAVPDEGVVPFLMQNLVFENDHFDWRLNLLGISGAMENLCAFPADLLKLSFDGPVAAICGEHSPYVRDHAGGAFRPMFPQLALDVVDGAGHWVHADQPEAFLQHVRGAIGKRPPGAAVRRVH